LDYFFGSNENQLLIEAVGAHLLHLASPLDPLAIDRAAGFALEAVHLNAKGSLGASLSIGGSSLWQSMFKVVSDSLDLDETVNVSGSAEIGFQAALRLEGLWNIWVCPMGSAPLSGCSPQYQQSVRKLRVKLQRANSTAKSSTFSLNAGLEISGLDKIGDILIQRFLPDVQPLIEKLEPFLKAGNLLKDLVKSKLDDLLDASNNNLKQRLIDVLVGNTDSETLAQIIGNAVAAAANQKLDLLQEDAQNAATGLLQTAAAKLGLKENLTTDLVNIVTPTLSSFLTQIKQDLLTKLTEYIGVGQDQLQKLLKVLSDVGETVGQLADDINQKATQLLTPVIRLLEKYRQVRQTVVDAVKKAAKLKLGLSISHSMCSQESFTSLLEFDLDVENETARKFYRQMLVGDFRHALDAWRRHPDGSLGFTLFKGTLKEQLEKTSTTTFSLDLLGFKFTSRTILSSDIQTYVDLTGNICLATADGKIEKYKQWGKESQTLRFTNLTEVAGTLTAAHTRNLSCGFWLSYKDESLKAKELETFLSPLENNGLIPDGTLTVAMQKYQQLTANNARQKTTLPGIEVGLSLPFNSDHLKKLIAVNPNTLQYITIYNLEQCHFPQADKRQKFENLLKSVFTDQAGNPMAVFKIIQDLGKINRPDLVEENYFKMRPPDEQYFLLAASYIGLLANHFEDFVATLRACAQLDISSPDFVTQAQKQLNQFNHRIQDDLKPILEVNPGEDIQYSTLAFMLTMAKLCGMNSNVPPLIPVIQWLEKDNKKKEDLVVGPKKEPAE